MQPNKHRLILASKSPRRHFLLKELGLDFETRIHEVDESFPSELQAEEIPLYLCRKKAESYQAELKEGELVITADTIVWINGEVLNKPADAQEAASMLRKLSGQMHQVFTGVCLSSNSKIKSFHAETKVFFRDLSDAEIEYYIHEYKPYDKAGAYGAQDWIGLVGVMRLEGTYFNVMGLPMYELYAELNAF